MREHPTHLKQIPQLVDVFLFITKQIHLWLAGGAGRLHGFNDFRRLHKGLRLISIIETAEDSHHRWITGFTKDTRKNTMLSKTYDPTPPEAGSAWFSAITTIFITCLIVANILAVKLTGVRNMIVPASLIIFPIIYILGAVITEVYGLKATRRIVWLGFACSLIAVAALWIGQWLPAADVWNDQNAYEAILGYTPRILAASFAAVLIGEFANAHILIHMKTAKLGPLWLRVTLATVIGLGVDSLIFTAAAFLGTVPLAAIWSIILVSWALKAIYVLVLTPITLILIAHLKRVERITENSAGYPDLTPVANPDISTN